MILGIDQGTTGTRATVVDLDGRIVSHAYLAHRQIHPEPGWVEHDPLEIWENTRTVAQQAVAASRAGCLAAIGIANQGETVLVWDRFSGRPLHNALVWQDLRAQSWMDGLARNQDLRREVAARTGLRLDAYFSAGKLRWLLDHVPGAAELIAAGHLAAGTIDTWLIWKLTGGGSFVTDPSTAARTLWFNIHTLAYDEFLLDRFAIPASILPELRPTVGELGTVIGLGRPLEGTRILASLVDQPAAMVGQGCLAPGQLKATYGTGCFLYLNTGTSAAPSEHGLLRTIAWQRDGRVTYALDGGIFAAGSVVTWLRDAVGLARSELEIDSLAASVAEPGEVICVPALAGLAAPYWRRNARAAWLGMSLATTRAHLVRAAFEGIACRVVEVVRAMESDSGMRVASLRVDGGLTGSATLMQIQADLLGVPIEVSAEAEATVLGASALAASGAGLWSDQDILGLVKIARVLEPRVSEAEREARLARFARAARLVQSWADSE